ncbi:MAG: alpha/beta hydrolase [Hyphomicrobium sp.]|nr:alpha/beta hydrolase [Hyphomicrobium sp.]
MTMVTTLIVPGLHSSGEDHWQTWLEHQTPASVRVIQRDWRTPDLSEWSRKIRNVISATPGRHLVVAHSFGVLASVQAATDLAHRISGALLVAPADPERFGVADLLPAEALPFPAVVVGSTNDPWMSLDAAAHWADFWNADLVNLGEAGHINSASGYGPWPEGLALLERLRRRAARIEHWRASDTAQSTLPAAHRANWGSQRARGAGPQIADAAPRRRLSASGIG